MIVLIVLFKWKEEVSPEQIDLVMQAITGMKSKISGLLEIYCGKNFDKSSPEFKHGVFFQFRDREAFEFFGPHPAHQEVVKNHILPIMAENLCVTYKVE